MSERKASDLFVECLEAEGVKYVFGIPGEETLLAVDVRCLMRRQPPLIDQRSPQDRLFPGLDGTAARAGHGLHPPSATRGELAARPPEFAWPNAKLSRP
jgi:hypothetical protein